MLTSLLLFVGIARADDCPPVEPTIRRAEEDALSYFLADAELALDEAAVGFGCQPTNRATLVRYWLAKAMVWQLADDPRLPDALAAARALDGNQFTNDLGGELKSLWAETDPAPLSPALPLKIRGLKRTDRVLVDVEAVDPPSTPPGLHLVQVERDGTIVFGRIVAADAGATLTLSLTEATARPSDATDSNTGATGGGLDYTVPLPMQIQGGRILDAADARVDFAYQVVPAALTSMDGRETLRRRRRNARSQVLTVGAGLLAGYLTYLAGYRWTTSDQGGAWGFATLSGGGLTAAAVTYELVLTKKRAATRRDLVGYANRALEAE